MLNGAILSDLIAWVVATITAISCVMMHYEAMLLISDRLVPWGLRHAQGRRTMILSMIALMVGHVVEIWLFAATLLAMSRLQWFGGFAGAFDGGFGDFLYFSAVNYTSLGYGDIHPIGSMRAVAVTEALTGLMMIGWSASFTYLKMEQIWQTRASVRRPKRDVSTDVVVPVAAPDSTHDRDT